MTPPRLSRPEGFVDLRNGSAEELLEEALQTSPTTTT